MSSLDAAKPASAHRCENRQSCRACVEKGPPFATLLRFSETLLGFRLMERARPRPATGGTETARPISIGQPSKGVHPSMAYIKPLFKQSTIQRGLDAAQKSPVPVRSVDFTAPDGTKLSFNIGDPVTTTTNNELDEWMAKKNAS
jgi:hypothetical protein